jgi:outer membrane immunogenic protein
LVISYGHLGSTDSWELMMKSNFLSYIGACALAAAALPATAADLPVTKAPVAVQAPLNWSGVYLGLHAGSASMRTSWTGTSVISVSETFRDRGWLAGGTIGANWQAQGSPWVFGVEADASWTDLHAQSSPIFCTPLCHSEMDWFATARVRGGLAIGALMPFVTAGGAATRIHAHTTALDGFDKRYTKYGWTAGGGFEAMLPNRWTVKLEYLYADFGRNFLNVDTSVGPPPLTLNADFVKVHVWRVGLNKLF